MGEIQMPWVALIAVLLVGFGLGRLLMRWKWKATEKEIRGLFLDQENAVERAASNIRAGLPGVEVFVTTERQQDHPWYRVHQLYVTFREMALFHVRVDLRSKKYGLMVFTERYPLQMDQDCENKKALYHGAKLESVVYNLISAAKADILCLAAQPLELVSPEARSNEN